MQKKLWPAVALAAAVCVAARADVPDFPLEFAPTSAAMNAFGSAAAHRRADTLVSKMTLDEKLQFIHSEYAMSACREVVRATFKEYRASAFLI